MHAGDFDSPSGRAGVEEGFAEPLEHAGEIYACNSEGREIDGASDGATEQAKREYFLAAARVGECSGEKTGAERHERENADHVPDGFVGSAEVVSDVRGEARQHCSDAKEP
jgi:hypothetical protein